jgi:FkbM family methyltransferase
MKTRRTIQIAGKPVHFDLDLSQFSQKHIYDMTADGLYEIETVRMMERLLKPGDTFIDVGAHVGYFSMIAAALVGEHGSVWALEPDPLNTRSLLDNAALNGAVGLFPLPMAAGRLHTYQEFYTNLDNDGGHAFWDVGEHPFNAKSKESPTKRKVHVMPLDALPGYAKVIKIDAEGAEGMILSGAPEKLEWPHCAVICEINRFALAQMGTTEQELRTFMHERGYRCWYLPPNEDNPQELAFGQTTSMEGYVFNVLFKKGEL